MCQAALNPSQRIEAKPQVEAYAKPQLVFISAATCMALCPQHPTCLTHTRTCSCQAASSKCLHAPIPATAPDACRAKLHALGLTDVVGLVQPCVSPPGTCPPPSYPSPPTPCIQPALKTLTCCCQAASSECLHGPIPAVTLDTCRAKLHALGLTDLAGFRPAVT